MKISNNKYMITISIAESLLFGVLSYLLFYLLFYKNSFKRYQLGYFIIHCYVFLLVSITIFPIYYDFSLIKDYPQDLGFHLTPFTEMFRLYKSDSWIFFKNIIGNFLLLIPLTLIIIIFKKVKWYQLLIIVILFSLSIELIQLSKNYFYQVRVNLVDIDDFILNISGAMLFYFGYKLMKIVKNKNF